MLRIRHHCVHLLGRNFSACRYEVKIMHKKIPSSTNLRVFSTSNSPQQQNQPNKETNQIVNVPNCLTFGRILATPYLSWLILDGNYQAAIGVFALAGFTDWLDGYIARTYNQQSVLGSFLDPLADKLMIGMLSVSLAYQNVLPLPLVVLIFGRDAMLVGGTIFHRLRTKDEASPFFDTTGASSFQVEPSFSSKANTALQFLTLGCSLTNAAWMLPGDTAMNFLFCAVTATTVVSGTGYARDYYNHRGALVAILDKTKAKVIDKTKERVSKTKDMVAETKHLVIDKTKDKVNKTKDMVNETKDKVYVKTKERVNKTKDIVNETREKVIKKISETY